MTDNRWLVSGFASAILLVISTTVHSGEQNADHLVQRALAAEVNGRLADRNYLLAAALAANPNCRAAHWHLGQIETSAGWQSPDEAARDYCEDVRCDRYVEQRKKTPKSAEGHWDLANWCRVHELTDERRAHLFAASALAPDSSKVHKALGRSLHGGRWMTDEDFARSRAEQDRLAAAYRHWKPELLAIRRQLMSSDANTAGNARQRLLAIADLRAIPAAEEVLSLGLESTASLVVEWLTKMSHRAATLSLVRHAVWSEWPTTRAAAIRALTGRDPEHVIPALIDFLRPSAAGTHTFPQLGKVWFFQDFDTTYIDIAAQGAPSRVVIPQSARFEPAAKGPLHAAVLSEVGGTNDEPRRIDELSQRFDRAEAANSRRIANARAALIQLTGEDSGEIQQDWQKSWFAKLDSYFDPNRIPKPERFTQTRVRRVETIGLSFLAGLGSCFISGTPIWTKRGPVPIERIELGELVLAQDPATGELAYRPVIDRTVRPKVEIVRLTVNGESLGATHGHPVWVSWKGWVKVKDLNPGSPLRAAGGVTPLATIEQGEPAEAYNLVVADFGTYFVGRSKLLVHDYSPIRDMPRAVPGQTLDE